MARPPSTTRKAYNAPRKNAAMASTDRGRYGSALSMLGGAGMGPAEGGGAGVTSVARSEVSAMVDLSGDASRVRAQRSIVGAAEVPGDVAEHGPAGDVLRGHAPRLHLPRGVQVNFV